MSKILVRSIVFRPPCPFGIKIAPIEIQSPCDGVESVTNLYMYEQIFYVHLSVKKEKQRNKNKTEHHPPKPPKQNNANKKKQSHNYSSFFSLRRNIL